MSASPALHAFTGYGVELEYMIVDRQTLSVLPVADELLRQAAGARVEEVARGKFGWSNELALHVVELKNARPDPALAPLPAAFQSEVLAINELLESQGARLMPTAMHPWMEPLAETRLWPHDDACIYKTYDRIFGCKAHGWSNLQSMQLNLPFSGDAEFSRLHAAIRLVLPILPALAASSPFAEGRSTGFMDFRMESYRTHQAKVLSTIGQVIPDTVTRRAEYRSKVMAPIYRDILPFDPDGVLRHEWLNARGAIPRFERNAIEIRVIDVQECPQADLAIAAVTSAVVKALYQGEWSPLAMQQAIGTDALVAILHACIRDAEQAVIDDAGYLQLMAFPGRLCTAGELWRHLMEAAPTFDYRQWHEPLDVMLERGPLARRIVRAVGPDGSKARLQTVYRELCECLATGRMFVD
ncbi:glutamate--cysteine ligase [Sulfurimicrobium lacus]|uniref:Glutamate--cysteine ligase n=1 Tax=Sulfurimicrobium lacus TaxID=2715678 RepID=A0A6F8VC94_9PROT|nr:glutamate-cysteine ligase family protein [Sulfurimicrobium lacus]BCB27463.1 glutamate--cysteine ligase [Sulfurimicrobium lacus]